MKCWQRSCFTLLSSAFLQTELNSIVGSFVYHWPSGKVWRPSKVIYNSIGQSDIAETVISKDEFLIFSSSMSKLKEFVSNEENRLLILIAANKKNLKDCKPWNREKMHLLKGIGWTIQISDQFYQTFLWNSNNNFLPNMNNLKHPKTTQSPTIENI